MPSAAVVTGGPPAEVWQSPGHAIALEGGSIHITCSSRGPLLGIYLKRVLPKASNVIYYEEGREATVDERFRGRVTFSGLQHNLTISVHRLQLPDTGAYACQAIMDSEVWGSGTLVVVTGREGAPPGPPGPAWGSSLCACSGYAFQLEPTASRKPPGFPRTHTLQSPFLNPQGSLGLPACHLPLSVPSSQTNCLKLRTAAGRLSGHTWPSLQPWLRSASSPGWGWGQCVRAEGHRSVWPRMSSTSQLLSGSREEPAGVPRELAVWESPAPPHALHPVSGAGRVHSRVHVGRNLRTEPQQGRAWGPGGRLVRHLRAVSGASLSESLGVPVGLRACVCESPCASVCKWERGICGCGNLHGHGREVGGAGDAGQLGLAPRLLPPFSPGTSISQAPAFPPPPPQAWQLGRAGGLAWPLGKRLPEQRCLEDGGALGWLPGGRHEAFFQIRRLCCAGGESSVCVIYEDMSLSRSNTVSLPSQFQ